ncbi:MAG TPA: 2-octaprenyl-6-methoxyphenyl hydroxylase [Steroidobacteraceae bacterium]
MTAPVDAFDVVIVGGGMVGASLALGLSHTRARVCLIESVPADSSAQPSFDERTTALGNASRRIFEALGVWDPMVREAGVIRTIHVSDSGRFGFARLRAHEQGVDAFGYVIPNRVIGAALWQKLAQVPAISIHVPARPEDLEIAGEGVRLTIVGANGAKTPVTARLVVAADGAQSAVRAAAGIGATVEDYGQIAVVTSVESDTPQDGTAYERFTPAGPIAVLPLRSGAYGVIWTLEPARASEMLAAPDDVFLRELQAHFGWRAGRFVRVGKRASYPLTLSRAETTVAKRAVLIGNAAQALHPVAGQGFNLGLRDAAMLAETVARAGDDPGAPDVLEKFAEWRAQDRTGVIRFTDSLVKLFSSKIPGIGVARNLGLLLFDLTPPAKRALARVGSGFAGPIPRMARGLPLV